MQEKLRLTNEMIHKATQIGLLIGQFEGLVAQASVLKRENRLKTIQATLAIEQNSLSLEQVTAIVNGKRVLGHPQDVQEVKNAFEAYDIAMTMNPFSEKDFLQAHALLTQNLVFSSGSYRQKDVGVFDGQGQVVHLGARPQFVPELMKDLFTWLNQDDTPLLIKSCVFHFELEIIHPFEDGNGRMGRLWQTLLLSKFSPALAWLPIETLIHDNQEAYYGALSQGNKMANAGIFIDFMLDIILKTLEEYVKD